MWRLEAQLRGNLNSPDFLYEATRVYLMLGNAGPLDVSLVREWMKLDWQTAYPGLGYAALRDTLLRALDALLSDPLPQVKLDGELVVAGARRGLPRCRWRSASIRASVPPQPRSACRHGCRVTRWVRPVCRCSCGHRASG